MLILFISAVDDTYNAMNDVDTTQNSLATDWETFEAALGTIKTNIDNECTSCGCCGVGGFPTTAGLVVNADYRDLLDVCTITFFPSP